MADEPRLTYEEFLVLAQLLGLAMDDEDHLQALFGEVEPMYERMALLRSVDSLPDAPLKAPEAASEG